MVSTYDGHKVCSKRLGELEAPYEYREMCNLSYAATSASTNFPKPQFHESPYKARDIQLQCNLASKLSLIE